MIIRVMSDLHITHAPIELPVCPSDKDGILVLSGDIAQGLSGLEWLRRMAIQFKHVVYVLGNYEYFHESIDDLNDQMLSKMPNNVHLLIRDSITIEGVRFIGATLWTDCRQANPSELAKVESFLPLDAQPDLVDLDVLSLHTKDREYIEACLQEPFSGKTVVVTHHVPSFQLVSSSLKYSYATNLDHWFHDYDFDMWICGHSHESGIVRINNIPVVQNCRGYPGELTGFIPNLQLMI